MTLSLNPSITEEAKNKNTEIKLENTDIITQNKPLPTQETQQNTQVSQQIQTQNQSGESNAQIQTESNAINKIDSTMPTQETQAQQRQETQQDAQKDITQDKGYQEYVKALVKARQAKQHEDNSWGILEPTVAGLKHAFRRPTKDDIPSFLDLPVDYYEGHINEVKKTYENEASIYDFLAKYGEKNKDLIGLKEIDQEKLKNAKLRQSIKSKDAKDLTQEEQDY